MSGLEETLSPIFQGAVDEPERYRTEKTGNLLIPWSVAQQVSLPEFRGSPAGFTLYL